jgi:protein SCO1
MRLLVALAFASALAGCAHQKPATDFTLRDQNGAAWTLSAQRGKAIALTFGYTHCADTCPATLAKLARIASGLGPRANGFEVAFVTVDPQRDSPAVLRAYLARFGSDRLVGLTGSPSDVAAVERAYYVWAQQIPGKHGGHDYDEAHSSAIYLIDANGAIRTLQGDDDSQATLARAIGDLLG